MEHTNSRNKYASFEEVEESLEIVRRDILNVLRSSGKSRSLTDLPLLEYYLNDVGYHPFIKNYSALSLNHVSLIKDLKNLGASVIYKKENIDEDTFDLQIESVFYRMQKGYYMDIEVSYVEPTSYTNEIQSILKELSNKQNLVLVSSLVFLCPDEQSPLYSKTLENNVHDLIKKHCLAKNVQDPYVGMICKDSSFFIKDFYITKEYNLNLMDLHYGEGFEIFHKTLLERFSSDSKGLVLFHGDPGTGKTYYIRNLIRDLVKIGKHVIYFPPNMVSHMVSPEIMTFLASVAMDMAEEGKSCVLLLEDAEHLLVTRGVDGRSDGITNLLNVTDGLLNDMLNIQVIATFNTALKNIDSALLRPERLIARKEFKKLKIKDAQKLVDILGVQTEIKEDVTLAEIYSRRKKQEVLIHEYDSNQKKIGF